MVEEEASINLEGSSSRTSRIKVHSKINKHGKIKVAVEEDEEELIPQVSDLEIATTARNQDIGRKIASRSRMTSAME